MHKSIHISIHTCIHAYIQPCRSKSEHIALIYINVNLNKWKVTFCCFPASQTNNGRLQPTARHNQVNLSIYLLIKHQRKISNFTKCQLFPPKTVTVDLSSVLDEWTPRVKYFLIHVNNVKLFQVILTLPLSVCATPPSSHNSIYLLPTTAWEKLTRKWHTHTLIPPTHCPAHAQHFLQGEFGLTCPHAPPPSLFLCLSCTKLVILLSTQLASNLEQGHALF